MGQTDMFDSPAFEDSGNTGNPGNYRPKTINNHDLFEVASALQKSIRRSDEHLACLCLTELIKSNYDKYAWKRIRIMASEDIVFDSGVVPTINALHENSMDLKKAKSKEYKLFLYHAVVLLCRSKKSRLVDWVKCVYLDGSDTGWDSYNLTIPEYAYDKHTLKGKMKGKGLLNFIHEGAKLINIPDSEMPTEEDYKVQIEKIWRDRGYIKDNEKP